MTRDNGVDRDSTKNKGSIADPTPRRQDDRVDAALARRHDRGNYCQTPRGAKPAPKYGDRPREDRDTHGGLSPSEVGGSGKEPADPAASGQLPQSTDATLRAVTLSMLT